MIDNWDKWYNWKKNKTNKSFDPIEIIAGNEDNGTEENVEEIIDKLYWKATYVSEKVNFYEYGALYKVIDPKNQKINKVLINSDSEKWYVLNDKNNNIYTFNKEANLFLENKYKAFDYVKFFFNEVAGSHGKFYIIETIEEARMGLILSREYDENKKNMSKIKEDEGKEEDKGGENDADENSTKKTLDDLKDYLPHSTVSTFNINLKEQKLFFEGLYMIFKDSLFKSKVSIDLNPSRIGNVSLFDEELVIEGIYTD